MAELSDSEASESEESEDELVKSFAQRMEDEDEIMVDAETDRKQKKMHKNKHNKKHDKSLVGTKQDDDEESPADETPAAE